MNKNLRYLLTCFEDGGSDKIYIDGKLYEIEKEYVQSLDFEDCDFIKTTQGRVYMPKYKLYYKVKESGADKNV